MWRHAKEDEKLKKYTDKYFLLAEQDRLTKKFGNLFTKFAVETSPCFSKYRSFHLHCSKRVSLKQLGAAPNIMLLGKILLCRTISPPIKPYSVLTIVEFPDDDLKDKAVFLSLYDYQHPLDERNEESIPVFPVGTILAVINPMLFQPSSNQICTVRCDNPADVSVLSQNDFETVFPGLKWPSEKAKNEDLSMFKKLRAPKFGDWMSVGNYWLEHKNYIGAIQAYSFAKAEHNDFDALSLRCSLFLKLRLYNKCLKDATEMLNRVPFHEEGIYYRACSLIGMRHYSKAKTFIKCHIEQCISPEDDRQKDKLVELLLKAENWNKQENYGDYDVVHMVGCSMSHYHDCADYIGSTAQQNVLGKGRGMIATKNIKCGDLILGAKALEVVYYKNDDEILKLPIETETLVSQSSARHKLILAIGHHFVQDPAAAESFYNLHDGTQKASISNNYKQDYNCVNMKRIAAICRYNSFSRSYPAAGRHQSVVGIWPAAALFNHGGFDSNSSWNICGNFLFVRASMDIMKGEEITLMYIPYTMKYSERLKSLSQYGFVCSCTLCVLESKIPIEIHHRRQEVLQELIYLESLPVVPTKVYENLIKELQQQYLDNPRLNVSTVYPQIRLARIYMRTNDHLKACKVLNTVYKLICKTGLTNLSLSCCYDGLVCAIKSKDIVNAKLWARAMGASLSQTYGKSIETH